MSDVASASDRTLRLAVVTPLAGLQVSDLNVPYRYYRYLTVQAQLNTTAFKQQHTNLKHWQPGPTGSLLAQVLQWARAMVGVGY